MSEKWKQIFVVVFLILFLVALVDNGRVAGSVYRYFENKKYGEFTPNQNEVKYEFEDGDYFYYPAYLMVERINFDNGANQIKLTVDNNLKFVIEKYSTYTNECRALLEYHRGISSEWIKRCSLSPREMEYKGFVILPGHRRGEAYVGRSEYFDYLEVYTDGVYFVYPIPFKKDVEASEEAKEMGRRILRSVNKLAPQPLAGGKFGDYGVSDRGI